MSDEEVQSDFFNRAQDNSYYPHYRLAHDLLKALAGILTVGSKGYPDILFEMHNRVFAIEVRASMTESESVNV